MTEVARQFDICRRREAWSIARTSPVFPQGDGYSVSVLTPLFQFVARLRHARAVHPRGVQYPGELHGSPPFPPAADVTVRLSKGVGTPGGCPDIFGLAMRVPTADGDWDVLLASTGTGRWSRMLPLPARSRQRSRYGTITPYRVRGELMWFMAVPQTESRFTLHVSGVDGEWRRAGTLELNTRQQVGTPIEFDPMLHRTRGVELAPQWLARLREAAYAGSRRGRLAARCGQNRAW